jgi:hypothetical protein
MLNHMMPLKRTATSGFSNKVICNTQITQPLKSLDFLFKKNRFRAQVFTLLALAMLDLSSFGVATVQAQSSSSSSSSNPSSGPGKAPSSDRSLSGFEQRGVSGLRPGQPGNPLPSAQSGGKDGKSGTNPLGNKNAPSQKNAVKGPDGRPVTASDGSDISKGSAIGSGNLGCINCATILQVRTVRMKPNPSWMLNSDARTPETANSHNSDLPTHGQGSSIGTSGNRSIINPDGMGAQFGKRMYEVTLMMDSGLTRKIHLDMMPGYNLGSKVRVTGNRLLPR